MWDRRLVNIYANKSVVNWFRKSAEEVHGKHISEVLGPAAARITGYVEGVFRGEPQVLEERIPTPDGGVKVAHVTYTPNVVDGVGRRGSSSSPIDITDRAQAQTAIRRDTEQAALFELRQSPRGRHRSVWSSRSWTGRSVNWTASSPRLRRSDGAVDRTPRRD